MNLKITKQQWENPKIARMTASKQRYEDMYDLGRMALVDWDNLKLTLQIIKEKGVFQHGFITYSRPLSVLMLLFQLLAASLEKTFKVVLISIEVFHLEKHKNHNLRQLFELMPDKIQEDPENREAYAIYVKPLLENLGLGEKPKYTDILDLDSVHLRYESAKHDFDIEIGITEIEQIETKMTHLIMELLNLANHAAKKNTSPEDLESCLRDQKPIITYIEGGDSDGNILTGITGVQRISISTKAPKARKTKAS